MEASSTNLETVPIIGEIMTDTCCLIISSAIIAPVVLILVWCFKNSSSKTQNKILGVYSQPTCSYYFKIVFFYIVVSWRRWRNGRKTADTGATAGYGVKSRARIEDMECPQPLSDHPKAIDAVYFNAADKEGNYLVMATARRPKGVINGLLYLRIPGIGVLELPKMPDTLLFGDGERYEAEGLSISPVHPMQSWKLEYSGKMTLNGDKSQTFDVVLDATWTTNLPYFDFDTDMHPWALSRSIAREPWSRQYFRDLEEAHQTHYEQMGKLRGEVSINDQVYPLFLDSMRDHSYGHKREWKLMRRYGLHMIHTEDGYSINAGIICQPVTASQLELGYVNDPSGNKIPISAINLPLWQHGEGGTPPLDYAFSFTADGKEYTVEVTILESPEFYIGWEWETRVVERMATFKVNGKLGWGLAEWDYRYHGGRPEKYAQSDPDWTRTINKG